MRRLSPGEEEREVEGGQPLLSWHVEELDSLGFSMRFEFEYLDDALITSENNVMKLIFEEGDTYLIGAEDRKKMGKDEFYVT